MQTITYLFTQPRSDYWIYTADILINITHSSN